MPAQTRSDLTDAGAVTDARAVASATPPEADLEQRHGVAAMLAPVPVPGTPAGSHLPGVQAAGAVSRDGHVIAVTQLAHAVPGKADGEVDTRPLRPIWQEYAPRRRRGRAGGTQ
jgi:hypothetical protein